MARELVPSPNEPDKMFPRALYSDHSAKSDNLQVLPFEQDEILVEHRLVHLVEFRDKRCNVTLKNRTGKRHPVNVQIWVLNNALIQLWGQSEKWVLASLQPAQIHSVSWEFKPIVPEVIWNSKARNEDPAWIVIASE